MVTLSLCVDLISLKIACDFVMNSVHYSKNTSSAGQSEQRHNNSSLLTAGQLCAGALCSEIGNFFATFFFGCKSFVL